MGLHRTFCAVLLSIPFQTQENLMFDSAMTLRDEARFKGAMEDDGNPIGMDCRRQLSSFADQLGHRDQDEMLKDNDSENCGG
jgi:hypothetical protein